MPICFSFDSASTVKVDLCIHAILSLIFSTTFRVKRMAFCVVTNYFPSRSLLQCPVHFQSWFTMHPVNQKRYLHLLNCLFNRFALFTLLLARQYLDLRVLVRYTNIKIVFLPISFRPFPSMFPNSSALLSSLALKGIRLIISLRSLIWCFFMLS